MTISVITVTYNVEKTIRGCLESIKRQSSAPQHIVVDGGSTDDTLAIVNSQGLSNMKMVSERDQGIYDAMNKGLRMADNDVIGILNGDDEYINSAVLESVAATFDDSEIDACYGDLVYVHENNPSKVLRYWRSGQYHYRKFYWGWMVPHPTFFVRKKFYDKLGGFNTGLGSAADYEIMLRFLVKYRLRVKYIPQVMIKMRAGGVSNATLTNRLRAHQMDRKAWKINGLRPYPWTLFFKPLSKIPQWFLKGSKSLES